MDNISNHPRVLTGYTASQGPSLAPAVAPSQSLEQPTSTKTAVLPSDVQELVPKLDNPSSQTSTCFPKLLLEIRRMIWSQALPGPRIIEITPREDTRGLHILKATHTALLSLVQACKESEEVVLRQYKKIAAQAWSSTVLRQASTAILLFDYGLDIIHFSGFTTLLRFLLSSTDETLDKITKIGLDLHFFVKEIETFRTRRRSTLLRFDLFEMRNLTKIVLYGSRIELCTTNEGLFDQLSPADGSSGAQALERTRNTDYEHFQQRGARDEISGAQILEMKSHLRAMIEQDHRLSHLAGVEIVAGSYAGQSQSEKEN